MGGRGCLAFQIVTGSQNERLALKQLALSPTGRVLQKHTCSAAQSKSLK